MKNVIIPGVSGKIAKQVRDALAEKEEVSLTLCLRNKARLRNKGVSKCRISESDVLDDPKLKEAAKGQDLVNPVPTAWPHTGDCLMPAAGWHYFLFTGLCLVTEHPVGSRVVNLA